LKRLYALDRGTGPLLVSVPHAGTYVPGTLRGRLSEYAATLPDTDWFVDRLYDFAPALGVGLLAATHSRYVIDLNRAPDDAALYTARTTGLIPLETFDGRPVYRAGEAPNPEEKAERIDRFWRPYHEALTAELERLREAHGFALLLDAHSIRSRVPSLFEGQLPDLNLGSNDGASAAADLVAVALAELASARRWSSVLDGRFKGGYITRHYGRPEHAVHALQLEMAQCVYMQEAPPGASARSMRAVREWLTRLLRRLAAWRPVQ